MKLLLDTHILLWYSRDTLPEKALALTQNLANELFFSPASTWEIVTKYKLGRPDFQVNPKELHKRLLNDVCTEIPLTARHMLGIGKLPSIHKDPFDRMLLAQAIAEGCHLLTSDSTLATYPGPIISV